MNDLLIDGNALYARCFFALKGDLKEVLRLCCAMTLKLLDQDSGGIGVPVSRTLFGWDGQAKTDKKRAFKPSGYVETRYRYQELLLSLFNTVHGYHPKFEADDIVATATFNSKADQIFVVSGDKDLQQLQGGNVSYYDLNTKQIMTSRKICAKFSIKHPSQVPLALAIIGDSGDNISGVPRWGPKKSAALFENVTDKMDFGEALKTIKQQIPDHLVGYFMESLDKTLLYTDVENVPEPSPLEFIGYQELRKFGVEGMAQAYERVAMQYEDRMARAISMIRGRV